MLIVDNLALTYPDGTEALKGINLQLERGVFGLLGPNGAGKSSLMQVLASLRQPNAGTIHFDGIDVIAQPQRLRRRLGYLPQDFSVYPHASATDLMDHLAVLKGIKGSQERRSEIRRLLQLVNLWDAKDRYVAHFSGGMRQRFGLAQALIGDPRLIIVDEPTAGLDPEERDRLYDVLARIAGDAVVIISTHIIDDVASVCDRVGVLAVGRLLFTGTPAELTSNLCGRIWISETEPVSGVLLSSRLAGRRRQYRIVAGAPPSPGARSSNATLEDGYHAVLKGAS